MALSEPVIGLRYFVGRHTSFIAIEISRSLDKKALSVMGSPHQDPQTLAPWVGVVAGPCTWAPWVRGVLPRLGCQGVLEFPMQAHSVLPSTCCRVLSFSEHDSVLLRFIKMRLGAQGIEYSATHLAERRERGAQQTCLLLGTTIISVWLHFKCLCDGFLRLSKNYSYRGFPPSQLDQISWVRPVIWTGRQ